VKGRLQTAFAIVAGVLLVATAALGGAFMQPGVDSVDDAAGQYVERSEGAVALGAGIAIGAAAYYTYDNYIKNEPSVSAEKLKRTDAQETRVEIYDQATIQKQNNELTHTAYGNYLNDTQSIALMEGKNAYIRALENGSTESVARNRATEAVGDYYAVKQKNLLAAWDVSMSVYTSGRSVASNTTGVNTSFVGYDSTSHCADCGGEFMLNSKKTVDTTLALTNGTTVNTTGLGVTAEYAAVTNEHTFDPTTTGVDTAVSGYNYTLMGVRVKPPSSSFEKVQMVNFSDFGSGWSEIQAQNTEVQSQLDTFISNTYSSYQKGDINTSDLVDPYLGAREYSPETSDTWTLRTLSAMGIDAPQNLSNIGRMNVTTDGTTHTGVLMSDGTPSGGYVVGNSYDASNITGSQFVATDDGGAVNLDGSFTLDSADGYAAGETVEYENVNYQTVNTSEFKALQEDLDQLSAEINAQQQQQRNAGGGGFLPDFGQGGSIPGLVLIAVAAALLITRD
jgi:hypothetical protein